MFGSGGHLDADGGQIGRGKAEARTGHPDGGDRIAAMVEDRCADAVEAFDLFGAVETVAGGEHVFDFGLELGAGVEGALVVARKLHPAEWFQNVSGWHSRSFSPARSSNRRIDSGAAIVRILRLDRTTTRGCPSLEASGLDHG